MSLESFAAAIRSARKSAGMNQTQLAQAVGLSQPQITYLERGQRGVSQNPAVVGRLEAALGLKVGELARHLPETSAAVQLANATANIIRLPLAGIVSAGPGISEPADLGEQIEAPAIFRGADCVYLVRGSSMTEELIRDGDYVFVRRSPSPSNKEIVIAWIGSEETHVIKRIEEIGKQKYLRAVSHDSGTRPPAHQVDESDMIYGVFMGLIRPPYKPRQRASKSK